MKKPILVSVCWIFIYIAVLPATETTTTSESVTTANTSEVTTTASTSEVTTTANTSEVTTTATTSEVDTTATTSEVDTTATTSEAVTTATTSEAVTTATTSEAVTTATTSEVDTTASTSEVTTTATTSEVTTTATTSEVTTTATTSEADTTATTSEVTTTATTSEVDTTASTSEVDTTATTSEADTTATTSEVTTTATTSEVTTTATTSEVDTTATTSEVDTSATKSEAVTRATTSEAVTTATTSEADTTASTSEVTTTASTSEVDTTATTSEADTSATKSEVDTSATTSLDTTAATSVDTTATTSGVDTTATTSGVDTTATTSGAETTATTSGADTSAATSGAETSAATSGADTSAATSGADTTATTSGADTSETDSSTATAEQTSASSVLSTAASTALTKSTSTEQSTVASTEAPVTGGYKPDLDNLVISLDFKISIALPFQDEFKDNSSIEYQNLTTAFREKLEPIYKTLKGFKKLEILGFRQGSTVAVHQVDVEASSSDVTDEKLKNVAAEIENLTIDGHNVTESIEDDIEKAVGNMKNKCNAEGICRNELICKGGETGSPYCVCKDDNCVNDGICHAVANDNYICSCKISDDYVYSGDHCEISTRKAPLSEEAIIGIAAGLGGGVFILVIIIFGCVCCARNRKSKERDSQSDVGDLPELNLPHFDKVRMSQLAQGNEFGGKGMPNYGFEPEPTDLRHHRKFDHGKEQGSFFERKEMDYTPRGSKITRREMYNGETSYNSFEELDAFDNPESRLSRDFTRSSNLRRSSNEQGDGPRADSRRSSQMRPRGNDPGYQLLTGSVQEGESVLQHINTERPYTIMRPNFR